MITEEIEELERLCAQHAPHYVALPAPPDPVLSHVTTEMRAFLDECGYVVCVREVDHMYEALISTVLEKERNAWARRCSPDRALLAAFLELIPTRFSRALLRRVFADVNPKEAER